VLLTNTVNTETAVRPLDSAIKDNQPYMYVFVWFLDDFET